MSEPTEQTLTPGLRRLIAVASALALPIAAWATVRTALGRPGAAEALALAVFFGLALLAELRPVALDEDGRGSVSLGFVFILAALILLGVGAGVVIAMASSLVAQLIDRKPLVRTVYNSSAYTLAAFAAGVPLLVLGVAPVSDPIYITAIAVWSGAAFVVVNVVLIALAISLHEGVSVRTMLAEEFRLAGPAFGVQAFLAALAAALWVTDPVLLVLMAGPLFTVTLYQRSSLASRIATRDAHTDSLTRLSNNRAYELGLAAALEGAGESRSELSLCLVDVDDFKRINDTYGHPRGDKVLVEVARLLHAGSECVGAFRIGGDEFAIVLACGEARARTHIDALYRRVSSAHFSDVGSATVSVGVATFPGHASDVENLERVADSALYWAKRNGKNRSCFYSPAVADAYSPDEFERRVEHQARLRAAENLIRVVDAKDEYTGAHSERVALLVEGIARQLGLDDEHVEQLKLAGRLHDLGKIAISDRVLQKPGKLTPYEVRQLAHHPELGASLLDGMDIRPVDVWIRHHHEHWDGSGYPHGLAAEEIPFGSRVILVADAYDAITTERSYRAASTPEEAMEELRRYSHVQFDPAIVAALEADLEEAGVIAPRELAQVVELRRMVA
ncbi:MAG: diguanylate cyclase [Thermoleophilia bacterium]|nr:diguanylate cyclase [Thermoleophilia bacterium]MDH4340461.1 diguanylate cyclase [Thermoleophilia bacterium]